MTIIHLRYSLLLATLLVTFSACQQNNDDDDDTAELPQLQFEHSDPLFIKSVDFVGTDNYAYTTEEYSYDTINNQTLLKTTHRNDGRILGISYVLFNYSPDGKLLTAQRRSILKQFPEEKDQEISFIYDAQGVIRSIKMASSEGSPYQYDFQKTNLATGYRLNWHNSNDSVQRQVIFDGEGRCIEDYYDFSGSAGNLRIEKYEYDGNGDVLKIMVHFVKPPLLNYVWHEPNITSRANKGNNLALHRRALLGSSLERMPLVYEMLSDMGQFSWRFPDEVLYSNFPALKGTIQYFQNSPIYHFDNTVEFDNIDRLTRFKHYNVTTGEQKFDMRISYME